jgi:DNA-binding transcriptional regulator YiaG
MESKIVETWCYEGLGFPINLEKVEMVNISGEWHPKMDIRKIADQAIRMLASRDAKLTGNQVKFIRTYFSMSLRKFAKEIVRESHTAVAKWEACLNEPTKMDINIEMMLRLYVIEKLESKTVKDRHKFYEKYLQLKQFCFSSESSSMPLVFCAA